MQFELLLNYSIYNSKGFFFWRAMLNAQNLHFKNSELLRYLIFESINEIDFSINICLYKQLIQLCIKILHGRDVLRTEMTDSDNCHSIWWKYKQIDIKNTIKRIKWFIAQNSKRSWTRTAEYYRQWMEHMTPLQNTKY